MPRVRKIPNSFDHQENELAIYDFTIPLNVITREEVKKALEDWGKHWAFQEEISDTGYEHYQGRISLRKKRFGNALAAAFKPICKEWHWSFTSNNGVATGMSYVIKVDTRTDGPWTDKDEPERYIPCHVRNMELRSFQQHIKDSLKTFEERWINVVITRTNMGKSRITALLNATGEAIWIPPLDDYKDIMQVVMCKMKKLYGNALIFDVPKGLTHRDNRALWNAIETIKTGFAFDTRHRYRELQFDPPVVWVFTNTNPLEDSGLYRENVFKLWTVSEHFELAPWTGPGAEQNACVEC